MESKKCWGFMHRARLNAYRNGTFFFWWFFVVSDAICGSLENVRSYTAEIIERKSVWWGGWRAVRGVGREPGGKVGGENHSGDIQVPFSRWLWEFHVGLRCGMWYCHRLHNNNSFNVVWVIISRWYCHVRGKSTSRVGTSVQNFLPSDVRDTRAIFVCGGRSVVYTAHAPV